MLVIVRVTGYEGEVLVWIAALISSKVRRGMSLPGRLAECGGGSSWVLGDIGFSLALYEGGSSADGRGGSMVALSE